MIDGRLLLAVAGAAAPVAGRRVLQIAVIRRDDGVESARQEVGHVTDLPRRRLREPEELAVD